MDDTEQTGTSSNGGDGEWFCLVAGTDKCSHEPLCHLGSDGGDNRYFECGTVVVEQTQPEHAFNPEVEPNVAGFSSESELTNCNDRKTLFSKLVYRRRSLREDL